MTTTPDAARRTIGADEEDIMRTPDGSTELVACPECGAPAEIIDRFVLESTDGPVEHATVRCARTLAHRYTVLVERLHSAPAVPATAGGAPAELVLSHRDRAILRAVAGGTAELLGGVEPDLFLDGRYCSDQPAARRLAHAGLIAAAGPVATGRRVAARLTADGRRAAARG